MLSTIFWVLFVGGQGLQAFPTLAECATTKKAVAASYKTPTDLLACVPQEKAK